MNRKTAATLLVLLNLCAPPCWSIELTDRMVQQVVKSAGVLDPKYSACVADISGHQVTVKLTKSPKDSEKDCRINSILLAQAIMGKDPSIDVVSVWFHATVEHWWIFQPNRATVGSYATGQISDQQLLRMLPMNLHVEARSVDDLLTQSVGPGPLREERLELLSYIKAHSGRASSTYSYTVLPTIDNFIPVFAEIESDARTGGADEAHLAEKINNLKMALRNEVQRFDQLPSAQRDAMIVAYKKAHGLTVTSAPATPQVRQVQIGSGNTSGSLAYRQFVELSKKYKEYTPDPTFKVELARRQQTGLRLMQLAEARQMRREWTSMFSSIEDAARSNDNAVVQSRLRALESALGLPSLPVMSK